MITKKDIEDILNEPNEDSQLESVLNKALHPYRLINVKVKSEQITSLILGTKEVEQKKSEASKEKERIKEEYQLFEEDILNYWNALTKKFPVLSAVLKIGGDRRKHLKQRFALQYFKDNYKKSIDKIATCPFLLGDNPRKWKVSFDFIISNDTNYIKILEGAYGDNGTAKKGINSFMQD